MKEKDLELQKILSIIKDYCDLEDLTNENFSYHVIYPFENKYKGSFGWDKGVTKGVLIFHKFDFVLKFPFVGYAEEEWEEEEPYGDITYFTNADSKDGWDYCLAEVNRYQEAKEIGVENLFLEMKEIDNIDGYSIYYQEYATPFLEGTSSSNEDQRKKARDMCTKKGVGRSISQEWLGDIINVYSINTLNNFLTFIKDFNIGDLHNGNIGYQGDHPVVIDYGDYYD